MGRFQCEMDENICHNLIVQKLLQMDEISTRLRDHDRYNADALVLLTSCVSTVDIVPVLLLYQWVENVLMQLLLKCVENAFTHPSCHLLRPVAYVRSQNSYIMEPCHEEAKVHEKVGNPVTKLSYLQCFLGKSLS